MCIRDSGKVLTVVDVAYGGMNGFQQAIELAAPVLDNVQFVRERELLNEYFDAIAQDTGKFCFGIRDTMYAIELGCVHTLVCHEELDMIRVVLKTNEEATTVVFFDSEAELEAMMQSTADEVHLIEQQSVVEWLCDNAKSFGARLEFVSDRSCEGSQFCRGFGGLGALLRYQVDFAELGVNEDDGCGEFDSDEDWDFI
eukprot:TRINITY_DN65879_c0_g1_i1.p1 TRINITY_DN65879_c0_g1~~TRINITY_DN65879_c0_g1_i1.p1  ORF type:complete len:198 (+),score=63.41 TRINITY_DN65879_c0_g1_i1:142-735(+)